MDDRFLFKAKRIDNGEWIVGNLLTIAKINSFICTGKIKLDGALKGHIYPEMYAVDESTICQCTEWHDKDWKLIFENDIVEYNGEIGVIRFGYYMWDESENIGFYIDWNKFDYHYRKDLAWWLDKINVSGSIFDNPELMEVE